MKYKDKQVEIISMDERTAVIRCEGSLMCVGTSDLKEEPKKEAKAPRGNSKK